MRPRVVVLGAGLAGLTAAYEIAKTGRYEVLLLERGGHFGGKVMSSEGYGGLPIEHGVHGWWKGYGNFFDVLNELHGEGWHERLFTGPHFSRFTAKLDDGRVVSMRRPPPLEGEPRVMPLVHALQEMIRQRALTWGDAASMVRLLVRMIAFDHARDYARWRDVTASGMCEELGVSKRAQSLVLANFTLASAFSPLDRVSGAAFMSSAAFYMFDAEASLAAKWLRAHPSKLVHQPLCAAIERLGGEVTPYARALGLGRRDDGRVSAVYVDRAHVGTLLVEDVGAEPRDLFADDAPWKTPPRALALARATLRHLEHVWLARDDSGDATDGAGKPIAWSGARDRPTAVDDPRRLEVEWGDAEATRVRVLEDRSVDLGWIDARDLPENAFREILWDPRDAHTPPEARASLRAALAKHAHLFAMHVSEVTTPPHLPLYVGRVDGEPRAFAGICTHLGGRLRWDAGLHMFACQLHGSRFRCDGQRACGPAEADLFTLHLVRDDARAPDAPARLRVRVRKPPRVVADHVIVATDVTGMQQILQASPSLHGERVVHDLARLRTTSVTVVRMILDRRVDDVLAIFEGFPTLDALFNVTKLQGVQLDRYRDRVHEVVELQIYRERTVGTMARDALVEAIRRDLAEAYGWSEPPNMLEPPHVAVHRNVYSGYDPESDAARPRTESGIAGLTFAGDWVHPDEGAWYMERAVRTGRLAARAILKEDGHDPSEVPLVPPVREPWALRTLARQGGQGMRVLEETIAGWIGVGDRTARATDATRTTSTPARRARAERTR